MSAAWPRHPRGRRATDRPRRRIRSSSCSSPASAPDGWRRVRPMRSKWRRSRARQAYRISCFGPLRTSFYPKRTGHSRYRVTASGGAGPDVAGGAASDLIVLDVTAARGLGNHFHVRRLQDHQRIRRDTGCQEDTGADGTARSHHRVAPDDCGAGINRHPVFNRRMTFLAAQRLARGQRPRNQTDALIHLDVVADDGRLAHHGPGAVIHEEMRADTSPRMEVHARSGVRPFGHDARYERDVVEVEFVRHPLHRDGFDERIGNDHFILAGRGRVAEVSRLRVGLEQFSEARQVGEKLERERARQIGNARVRDSGGRGVVQALADLVFQADQHALQKRRGYGSDFGGVDRLFVEEPGKQQAQKIDRDIGNGMLGGQILAVHVVDAARVHIRRHQALGQLGQCQRHSAAFALLLNEFMKSKLNPKCPIEPPRQPIMPAWLPPEVPPPAGSHAATSSVSALRRTTAWAMRGRLGFGLSLQPLVRLLLRRFFLDAVTLLQAPHKLVLAPGHEFQVVVGEFAPLLPDRAMHLLPLAFYLIPVHDVLLYRWISTYPSRVPQSTNMPLRSRRRPRPRPARW